jgi:hypothetical protein
VHKGSVLWKPCAHEIYVNEIYRIMITDGLGSSVAYSEIYISFFVLILI